MPELMMVDPRPPRPEPASSAEATTTHVRCDIRRARGTPCSVPCPERLPCGSSPSLPLAGVSSEGPPGLGQVAIIWWPPRQLCIDTSLPLSRASMLVRAGRGGGSVADNLTTLVHAQQAGLGSQQLWEPWRRWGTSRLPPSRCPRSMA